MRLKLPTLLYYPCPCCGAPLFARAIVKRQTLTTYQFCRKYANVENRFRRCWPAAILQGVQYGGGMLLALAAILLFVCLFLCLGGPEP